MRLPFCMVRLKSHSFGVKIHVVETCSYVTLLIKQYIYVLMVTDNYLVLYST